MEEGKKERKVLELRSPAFDLLCLGGSFSTGGSLPSLLNFPAKVQDALVALNVLLLQQDFMSF